MIIGLGCLAHDRVLVTETTWAAGKGRITRRETRFGGNVRNALATVAALEHPAGYLATVGTSSLSDEAMRDLTAHAIDTRFIERVPGADPVTSVLTITSDGERYIAFDDAPLATTPLPSKQTVDDALSEASVLLVDAPTAPPGSLQVVQKARAIGIPVVLDAERDPIANVMALIAEADHLVIPLSFGRQLTQHNEPSQVIGELWSEVRTAIVLTDGPRGSYAADTREHVLHLPAFDTPVVDTTGCGDAFHGAYAVSLARGEPLIPRVTSASAAAAVIAAREPGQPRTPTTREIARFIDTP